MPGHRRQSHSLYRRRRRRVLFIVQGRRETSSRVHMEQLPRGHVLREAAGRCSPRRGGLRHRGRGPELLRRPREAPLGLRRKGGKGVPDGGAAVPVPGRVGRRGFGNGTLRLRVGAVLQQPAVPVLADRGSGQFGGVVEAVDVGDQRHEHLPRPTGFARRRRQRVHSGREPQVRRPPGAEAVEQVRRGDVVVEVLRRSDRI